MSPSPEPEFVALLAIDWADQKHVWVLEDRAGKRRHGELAQRPEAVEAWVAELRRRYGDGPIAVALEQSRGALVELLRKYDRLVIYPVHPRLVPALRQALYPSGTKDDPLDAELILEALSKHRDKLRPLPVETGATRQLQFLVEDRRQRVDERTRHKNRLRDRLKSSYPQPLEWFDDIAQPMALEFLKRWPSLAQVQRARPATLEKFFLAHNCRSRERIQRRLDAIRQAQPLTEDRAVLEPAELWVAMLVRMIEVLRSGIAVRNRKIRQLMSEHDDARLFEALPGAAAALAPRLLVAMGTDRERFESAAAVSADSGIAPRLQRSGRREQVQFRWACPKFVRQSFHELARCSGGGVGVGAGVLRGATGEGTRPPCGGSVSGVQVDPDPVPLLARPPAL